MKSCNEMNMSIEFKKFYNKISLDMKTFEITIDHIFVYFIGSKLGLYVSFLIRLYLPQIFLCSQLLFHNLSTFWLTQVK